MIKASPRAELQRFALYLQGDRADITVQGDGDRWLVVLYKNGAFESRTHSWWLESSREAALSLAREVERCLQGARTFEDAITCLPETLRASGVQVPAAGASAAPPLDL
ncbi:hypothetical protein D3C86_1550330 [compost metagenome]